MQNIKIIKINLIIVFLLFLFLVHNREVFGISDRAVTAALKSFSADIDKLPENIQTASIVIHKGESEEYIDFRHLRSVLQDALVKSRISLIDRENIEDTIKEIKLGASGLLDASSVIEAGKLSGVDAFLFVTASVSGPFNKRITITIKGVDVTTGAVVFIEDYKYEEPGLFTPFVSVSYLIYDGYTSSSTLMVNNPTSEDWEYTETINGSAYDVYQNYGVIFTIPIVKISISAGVCHYLMQTPDIILENEYLEDYKYQIIDVEGYKSVALMGFHPFMDVSVPISWYLGDNWDRIRIYFGLALSWFDGGGVDLVPHVDEDYYSTPFNDAEVLEETLQIDTLKKLLFRTKLEIKLLSTVFAVINFNFLLPSQSEIKEFRGIQYKNSWDFSPIVGLGIKYSFF